jgi:site-specific recombinase XerD
MFDLIPAPEHAGEVVSLAYEQALLKANLAAGKRDSTRAAYIADGKAFGRWCRARGLDPLQATPHVIALHISGAADAGLSPASVARRVAGIGYALQLAEVPYDALPTRNKTVSEALAGIRANYPKPSRRKSAATTDVVRAMLDTCASDTTLGLRDRALLALGFAGAFRRSELVALDVEDLTEVPDGYRIAIRRSKTNKSGEPEIIPVGHGATLRPVEAVQTWLQAANITSGPIFREVHKSGSVRHQRARKGQVRDGRISAGLVALVVKKRAKMAGLDPRSLSAHSLRAGFITSAAEAGKNVFKIMDVSRHKSMDTMRGYVRSREMFRDYAGAGIL